MSLHVLVTGGAGFIGCHLVRALVRRGDKVRVIDSLLEQVHGTAIGRNPALRGAELVRGDVRDADAVTRALRGVDAVVHLAAEVGVGQSMYAIERYVSVNDVGTAVLCQCLIKASVKRLVVASSMSVYGEGMYKRANGALVEDAVHPGICRPVTGWNPIDETGAALTAIPTAETKRMNLASVYALTKFSQERMALTVAKAYGIEAVALRLFNAYGPGQALSNPYTGVLAIFADQLLHDESPLIFEDGAQRRDFVHVEDVVRAFLLALQSPDAPGRVFNIASGRDVSIRDVAEAIATAMGKTIEPQILGKTRTGDIRHCFADISLARDVLGYRPRRSFDNSLAELAEWVARQQVVDRVQEARRELERRGLVA